jgi:hypothetical protein
MLLFRHRHWENLLDVNLESTYKSLISSDATNADVHQQHSQFCRLYPGLGRGSELQFVDWER